MDLSLGSSPEIIQGITLNPNYLGEIEFRQAVREKLVAIAVCRQPYLDNTFQSELELVRTLPIGTEPAFHCGKDSMSREGKNSISKLAELEMEVLDKTPSLVCDPFSQFDLPGNYEFGCS